MNFHKWLKKFKKDKKEYHFLGGLLVLVGGEIFFRRNFGLGPWGKYESAKAKNIKCVKAEVFDAIDLTLRQVKDA